MDLVGDLPQAEIAPTATHASAVARRTHPAARRRGSAAARTGRLPGPRRGERCALDGEDLLEVAAASAQSDVRHSVVAHARAPLPTGAVERDEARRVGRLPAGRAPPASSPTVTAEGSRRSAGARRAARLPSISRRPAAKRPTPSPRKTTGPVVARSSSARVAGARRGELPADRAWPHASGRARVHLVLSRVQDGHTG